MELNTNIEHQYNLSGMKSGDWFLGCSKCWFQVRKNAAAVNECPKCLGPLNINYVKPEDVGT